MASDGRISGDELHLETSGRGLFNIVSRHLLHGTEEDRGKYDWAICFKNVIFQAARKKTYIYRRVPGAETMADTTVWGPKQTMADTTVWGPDRP
jgi:hypothetical protein